MAKVFSFWILQCIAMAVTCGLLPRLRLTGLSGAVGMVAALAFVNATVWDAALFFQVPDSVSMHAATVLLANGVVFWVLVKLLPGIEVEGVLPALAAPIVFSVLSIIITTYGADIDWFAIGEREVEEIRGVRSSLQTTEQ